MSGFSHVSEPAIISGFSDSNKISRSANLFFMLWKFITRVLRCLWLSCFVLLLYGEVNFVGLEVLVSVELSKGVAYHFLH